MANKKKRRRAYNEAARETNPGDHTEAPRVKSGSPFFGVLPASNEGDNIPRGLFYNAGPVARDPVEPVLPPLPVEPPVVKKTVEGSVRRTTRPVSPPENQSAPRQRPAPPQPFVTPGQVEKAAEKKPCEESEKGPALYMSIGLSLIGGVFFGIFLGSPDPDPGTDPFAVMAVGENHPVVSRETGAEPDIADDPDILAGIPESVIDENQARPVDARSVVSPERKKEARMAAVTPVAATPGAAKALPGMATPEKKSLKQPAPLSEGKRSVTSPKKRVVRLQKQMVIEDIRIREKSQKFFVRFQLRNLMRKFKNGHVYGVAKYRLPNGRIRYVGAPRGLKVDSRGMATNPKRGVSFAISSLVYKELGFPKVKGEILGLKLVALDRKGSRATYDLAPNP